MGGLDAGEWRWQWGGGAEEEEEEAREQESIAGEEHDPELAAAWKHSKLLPSSAICMLETLLPYTSWRTGVCLCVRARVRGGWGGRCVGVWERGRAAG
jgi:hypothetical protein